MADTHPLIQMFKNWEKVSDLTDGELIDEIAEHCDFGISTYQDALIQEMATRFQKAIDLDETPKGLTFNGYPVWPDEIK